jgi:rfaE bifunctional protein nucleotidyltransferase chain/domain
MLSEKLTKILSQREGKKVVFTNGCFDILHAGHVSYLNEAKSLGDILVIGVNSDESVKRIKGPERPINNQEDRQFLLENLKAVDVVEFFSADTPYELIKSVRPDILVKGGDWKPKEIVGHDIVEAYDGLVQSLTFKNGYSTTSLIGQVQGKS